MHASLGDWLNDLLRRLLFLPVQASSYARAIDTLHYTEFAVMVGLTAIIGVAVIAFCVRYPRLLDAAGAPRLTPRIEAKLALEIPVYASLLAFFLLLWWIGFRQFVAVEQPPAGALDVYVTGKQWMWKFAYPQQRLASANVLYAPAGRAVRLLLTSRDVIHSFFVPDLRLKRDAVPGMYTSIWFEAPDPGRHPIYCTELCGVGHSQMRGELVVLAPDAWETWASGQQPHPAGEDAGEPAGADLVAEGRDAAARHGCFTCHALPGSPVAGVGPSWQNLYGSRVQLIDGQSALADEAYLTRSMMDPAAEIVAGYPPLMPSYQGLLSAPETAGLVELIKSLTAPAPQESAR